jgi:hypothetical protein
MPRLIREKFEYELPPEPEELHSWADSKSARVKKGTPGREGRSGGDPQSKQMDNAVFYNTLPPGMDIEDQEIGDIRVQDVALAGSTDVSKKLVSAKSLAKGFTRLEMSPTDDNSQHGAGFYDEVEVDGSTGFVEKMNVMDRS